VFVAAARVGLMAVPMTSNGAASPDADLATRARLHGQRLVQLARALKAAPPAE
jgi:hypothetical protein